MKCWGFLCFAAFWNLLPWWCALEASRQAGVCPLCRMPAKGQEPLRTVPPAGRCDLLMIFGLSSLCSSLWLSISAWSSLHSQRTLWPLFNIYDIVSWMSCLSLEPSHYARCYAARKDRNNMPLHKSSWSKKARWLGRFSESAREHTEIKVIRGDQLAHLPSCSCIGVNEIWGILFF